MTPWTSNSGQSRFPACSTGDRLDELGYEEDEASDFEYIELGEEGHASSDIDQKIRLFRILDDFLDRRVGTTVARAGD